MSDQYDAIGILSDKAHFSRQGNVIVIELIDDNDAIVLFELIKDVSIGKRRMMFTDEER